MTITKKSRLPKNSLKDRSASATEGSFRSGNLSSPARESICQEHLMSTSVQHTFRIVIVTPNQIECLPKKLRVYQWSKCRSCPFLLQLWVQSFEHQPSHLFFSSGSVVGPEDGVQIGGNPFGSQEHLGKGRCLAAPRAQNGELRDQKWLIQGEGPWW